MNGLLSYMGTLIEEYSLPGYALRSYQQSAPEHHAVGHSQEFSEKQIKNVAKRDPDSKDK